MRSGRNYADEAARLHTEGATYGQIVAMWTKRDKIGALTAARLAHGLTQRQVADRWNELWPDPERPMSAKTISYWETGSRQPSRDSLNKLALLYRCSAGVLLDGHDHTYLDPAAHDGARHVQLLSVSLAVVTRIHPATGALCAYFLCDHLSGEPENRDPV